MLDYYLAVISNSLQVTGGALIEGVMFGLIPTVLVCLISYLFSRKVFKIEHSQSIIITMFAVFGCFLGVFISSSRVSVMAAILPLVITFISGYVAYSFKKDGEVFNQKIVPAAIMALIVAATFGAFFGGEIRQQAEGSAPSSEKVAEK